LPALRQYCGRLDLLRHGGRALLVESLQRAVASARRGFDSAAEIRQDLEQISGRRLDLCTRFLLRRFVAFPKNAESRSLRPWLLDGLQPPGRDHPSHCGLRYAESLGRLSGGNWLERHRTPPWPRLMVNVASLERSVAAASEPEET
jgi:hypothetical protein